MDRKFKNIITRGVEDKSNKEINKALKKVNIINTVGIQFEEN